MLWEIWSYEILFLSVFIITEKATIDYYVFNEDMYTSVIRFHSTNVSANLFRHRENALAPSVIWPVYKYIIKSCNLLSSHILWRSLLYCHILFGAADRILQG